MDGPSQNGMGTAATNLSLLRRSETILSIGLLAVLVVLLVPLPTVLLDMLLAGNLGVTVLLLLITVSVVRPLDISVFPSLLLLMTLYRLSLNVATTRLILLEGDAGQIVSTFGGFVVGGNLVVGLVIFLILVIIQFIVITKGSSRISEVAARFTLDALPGKQMAIDAELGAGAIDEKEARARREELNQETEFYGAMDGAGKFVRGDAIAGLIITGVNILGGVVLGVSNGMTVADALRRYSILTVGDGLVSQIPALIIATAAGLLVTKATSKLSLGSEIGQQLFANERPLTIGTFVLTGVALTPGLPKLPFVILSAGLLLLARKMKQRSAAEQVAASREAEREEQGAQEAAEQQEPLLDFVQQDRVCVEIGVRLVPLVDPGREKGLAKRITALRAELARKFGIWVPPIRVRDSLHLGPNVYRVLVGGREVARGKLRPDMLLAINPGDAQGELEGEDTTEPAFGLPALWIPVHMRQRAEQKGFTVVDPTTVLITHLGEILRKYAHELFSREDLQKLLDKVRETSPTVVDELKPDLIRMGELHQVLLLLLQERVPLTNLTRILEVVVQGAGQTKSPVELADQVRLHLGRDILDRLRDEQGRVGVVVMDPRLEMKLKERLNNGQLQLPHDALERLVAALASRWEKGHLKGRELTLLTDHQLRRPLRNAVERALPDLMVTAYPEIPPDMQVEIQEIVKLEEVWPAVDQSPADQSPGGRAPAGYSPVNTGATGQQTAAA